MTDTLTRALMVPELYPHPVAELQLIETHISWVILTGPYAYKIKKPVNLGFLDFSSLAQRRRFCQRELELNQRLAPSLYIEVVSITGSPEAPRLGGEDEAIEYAIKMVQFKQTEQFDRMLHDGKLHHLHITSVADKLAAFHGNLPAVDADSDFGLPEQVLAPVSENLRQIRERRCADRNKILDQLEQWLTTEFSQRYQYIQYRRSNGHIRECHGDVHLRNIAWHEQQAVIFDCIEFNEYLRCIDTVSEIAFMVMDLEDRGRPDLASWFLNRYLEHTGDYEGLRLLRFYLVYRALVRAKVDCIRSSQEDVTKKERRTALDEYQSYLDLASRYIQPQPTMVILMYGLSGSGKTYISDALLQSLPAVRLRSDVERKRIFNVSIQDRSGASAGIYAKDASRRTYERLRSLAEALLESGYSVIIDAAFLYRWQRKSFLELSAIKNIPAVIVECSAPRSVLEQRLADRSTQGRDPSDADSDVLKMQLENREDLTSDETRQRVPVDTSQPILVPELSATIKAFAVAMRTPQ